MNCGFRPLMTSLALAGVLSACARSAAPEADDVTDPVIADALSDPLMTDPDLATQNRVGALLTGGGVPMAQIPLELVSNESRAAAKADATSLLGGDPGVAPAATGADGAKAGETALLSWRQNFSGEACASRVGWTFGWASKMPAAMPVYPRGHVQEALGNSENGCTIRALNFRVAVSTEDVLAFYNAFARKAGFNPEHRADGDAHALIGKNGGSGFAVYVRPGPQGMSDVDLVTNGL